jgi:hypothetical protein
MVVMMMGLGATQASAQDVSSSVQPAVGSQVRVELDDGRQVSGLVLELAAETIKISSDGTPITVQRAGVRHVQVRTGRSGNGARGAVIGTLVGIVGGASEPLKSRSSGVCHPGLGHCTRTGAIAAGALGGMAVGALIGALIKSDDWSSATLGTSVALTTGPGSLEISATIRWPPRR